MDNPQNTNPAVSINAIEEKVTVQKQIVEKGKVRIVKKVNEEDETVTIPVATEEVKVEKIPINQIVENAPAVRYEGDTMIIPVVKEVIIIEKKLMLVEEVHVTKHTLHMQDQRTIPLRKEEVIVERIPSANNQI